MQACVCDRYGGPDVVRIEEVPTPVAGPGEILIRIMATTVTAGDWRVRSLDVPRGLGLVARLAIGLTGPRQPILGSELAGVVAAIGPGVTRFRPGEEVLAFPGVKMGCHAQFRVLAEDGRVVAKPARLSFEEAASLPFGGSTALHFLRKAGIRRGDTVLVVGASGSVGSALVQVAKHFGATVTGVASTANLDLVASLGADRVVDYTRHDVTRGNDRFDIIADTVGDTSFARYRRVLRPNGRLLAIAAGVADMLAVMWSPLVGRQRVIAGPAAERVDDLRQLATWAEQGVLRPVIDRCYDMSEIVAAHSYVQTRRKRGSVVVRVAHEHGRSGTVGGVH